ncbi:MAG: hypothetical protein ACPL7K_02745, partial [Armatimonadota bacterium]
YRSLATGVLVFVWLSAVASAQAASPDNADLQRRPLLPLGTSGLTPEERAQLPLPFGINFDYFEMSQTMLLRDASVSINGMPIPSNALNVQSLTAVETERSLRVDVWLLPFMNLYLLTGSFNGTAKDINASVSGMPLPVPEGVPFSGTTRGIGTTFSAAYRSLFFSYDYNVTWARVDRSTGAIPTVTHNPRVGVRFDKWRLPTQLYLGGFKMDVTSDEQGSITFPGVGQFDYKLKALPESAWNFVLGVDIDIRKKGRIIIEKGFGNRTHTLVSSGLRF